jgi:hypothetical protein
VFIIWPYTFIEFFASRYSASVHNVKSDHFAVRNYYWGIVIVACAVHSSVPCLSYDAFSSSPIRTNVVRLYLNSGGGSDPEPAFGCLRSRFTKLTIPETWSPESPLPLPPFPERILQRYRSAGNARRSACAQIDVVSKTRITIISLWCIIESSLKEKRQT